MTTRRLAAVPASGPLRDGVYLRVSAVMGRDDERFLSPDLQRSAIERARKVAPGPSVVVGEWSDIDVSGRSMDRPGLSAALAVARAGGMDRLWVLDLSRWARNTSEGLAGLAEIEATGCRVFSTSEQVDLHSPEGYFSATLMLAVHKLYSDQLGRRWRAVHEHMASQGRQVGLPPFGYRRGDGGAWEVDPVAGPAVARAFADYAAGVPMRVVRERLSDAKGRPVAAAWVRKLLDSPVYAGAVRYRGQTFPGRHEPLVDAATAQAVAYRRVRDGRAAPRALAASYALSGLVVCDVCSGGAWVRPSRRDGRRAYICGAQSELRACLGCGSLNVQAVEGVVLEWLRCYAAQLRTDSSTVAAAAARSSASAVDRDRLRRELERTRQARARLAVDFARRDVGKGAYVDADALLAADEGRLSRLLADAAPAAAVPVADRAALVEEVLSVWGQATAAERNTMLRQVVRQVRLRPGVGWRQPAAERVEVVPL